MPTAGQGLESGDDGADLHKRIWDTQSLNGLMCLSEILSHSKNNLWGLQLMCSMCSCVCVCVFVCVCVCVSSVFAAEWAVCAVINIQLLLINH